MYFVHVMLCSTATKHFFHKMTVLHAPKKGNLAGPSQITRYV